MECSVRRASEPRPGEAAGCRGVAAPLRGQLVGAADGLGAGREVPLVGRDRQLAALRTAFASARSGTTTVARVCGSSGMGKTTLVECFLDRLAGREAVTILRGRCHRQESVPFKGVDGLIDALSQHLAAQAQADLRPLLPTDMGACAGSSPCCGVSSSGRRAGKRSRASTRWRSAAAVFRRFVNC